MNQLVHRFLSAGILMVWGSVMGIMYFTGRIDNYLAPSFRIYVAIAAGVLVLLAVVMLFMPTSVRAEDLSGCANSMARSVPGHVFAGVVLVVPLLVAFNYSPSEFSATTILNRGFADVSASLPGPAMKVKEPALPMEDPLPGEDAMPPDVPAAAFADTLASDENEYLARNADGQIIAELIDLLYAAQEPTMLSDFKDKEVELVGQFMPEQGVPGAQGKLVRMMVSCCAADARPIAVDVKTADGSGAPEMSWVRVTGKATFPVVGGKRIPILEGAKLERTDPPGDLFVY